MYLYIFHDFCVWTTIGVLSYVRIPLGISKERRKVCVFQYLFRKFIQKIHSEYNKNFKIRLGSRGGKDSS